MNHASDSHDIESADRPEQTGDASQDAVEPVAVPHSRWSREVGLFGHRRRPIYAVIVVVYCVGVVVASVLYLT